MHDDDLESLLKAIHFAAEKHRDQRRKGAEAAPYINHPIEVAELLRSVGRVTHLPTLVSAILHDTVEDTDATLEQIEQAFGSTVAAIVAEVTDDRTLAKADRKRLQIEHAPHLSVYAQQIKLADKISNVRAVGEDPPPDWSAERRVEYLNWAEMVVEGLRGCNPWLETLFDETLQKSRQNH